MKLVSPGRTIQGIMSARRNTRKLHSREEKEEEEDDDEEDDEDEYEYEDVVLDDGGLGLGGGLRDGPVLSDSDSEGNWDGDGGGGGGRSSRAFSATVDEDPFTMELDNFEKKVT